MKDSHCLEVEQGHVVRMEQAQLVNGLENQLPAKVSYEKWKMSMMKCF